MDLGSMPALPDPAARLQAGRGLGNTDLHDLGTHPDQRAALRRAAEEFESIFAYQMVSAMRKTVSWGEGGLVPKGSGEKVFESMLDEEWAKKIVSQNGPQSLGETIYRQMAEKLGWEAGEAQQQGPFDLRPPAPQWLEMEAAPPPMRPLPQDGPAVEPKDGP